MIKLWLYVVNTFPIEILNSLYLLIFYFIKTFNYHSDSLLWCICLNNLLLLVAPPFVFLDFSVKNPRLDTKTLLEFPALLGGGCVTSGKTALPMDFVLSVVDRLNWTVWSRRFTSATIFYTIVYHILVFLWDAFLFSHFLLLFSYSSPTFFPKAFPYPISPTPTVNPPIVHAKESSICVPLFAPSPSFPHSSPPASPPVTVSLFFISKCLALFCLFVLLIRFHFEVRSYGICLSLPDLFHLA